MAGSISVSDFKALPFDVFSQVRRAIQQLFFPNKTFWWPRHIAIAVTLLTLINLLVIFAPNILGIFGIIGGFDALSSLNGVILVSL